MPLRAKMIVPYLRIVTLTNHILSAVTHISNPYLGVHPWGKHLSERSTKIIVSLSLSSNMLFSVKSYLQFSTINQLLYWNKTYIIIICIMLFKHFKPQSNELTLQIHSIKKNNIFTSLPHCTINNTQSEPKYYLLCTLSCDSDC